jgi:hypothetical protein
MSKFAITEDGKFEQARQSDQKYYSNIAPDDASHVLTHFGYTGKMAGSFTMTLIRAMAVSDRPNRERLARGFPSLVAAVEAAQNDEKGIERLKMRAEGIEVTE